MKVWWCPICDTSDNYRTKKLMVEHMKQDHGMEQMIEYLLDTHQNPWYVDQNEGYTNRNVAT